MSPTLNTQTLGLVALLSTTAASTQLQAADALAANLPAGHTLSVTNSITPLNALRWAAAVADSSNLAQYLPPQLQESLTRSFGTNSFSPAASTNTINVEAAVKSLTNEVRNVIRGVSRGMFYPETSATSLSVELSFKAANVPDTVRKEVADRVIGGPYRNVPPTMQKAFAEETPDASDSTAIIRNAVAKFGISGEKDYTLLEPAIAERKKLGFETKMSPEQEDALAKNLVERYARVLDHAKQFGAQIDFSRTSPESLEKQLKLLSPDLAAAVQEGAKLGLAQYQKNRALALELFGTDTVSEAEKNLRLKNPASSGFDHHRSACEGLLTASPKLLAEVEAFYKVVKTDAVFGLNAKTVVVESLTMASMPKLDLGSLSLFTLNGDLARSGLPPHARTLTFQAASELKNSGTAVAVLGDFLPRVNLVAQGLGVAVATNAMNPTTFVQAGNTNFVFSPNSTNAVEVAGSIIYSDMPLAGASVTIASYKAAAEQAAIAQKSAAEAQRLAAETAARAEALKALNQKFVEAVAGFKGTNVAAFEKVITGITNGATVLNLAQAQLKAEPVSVAQTAVDVVKVVAQPAVNKAEAAVEAIKEKTGGLGRFAFNLGKAAVDSLTKKEQPAAPTNPPATPAPSNNQPAQAAQPSFFQVDPAWKDNHWKGLPAESQQWRPAVDAVANKLRELQKK